MQPADPMAQAVKNDADAPLKMKAPIQRFLRRLFDAAVDSAQPALCVPAHLPPPPRGRTIVVGAGKASAAMALAVERAWQGPLSGLVVTRYGYQAPCSRIEIVQAAHPVPDERGLAAAQKVLEMVRGLGPEDLVLCLISGGGSALLPAPLAPLTLAHKQQVNQDLLRSGASIGEVNCVRRHLSAIKGGRLAVACHPARVVTLLISDVPGDKATDIASGPTAADTTSCADALAILERYRIVVPGAVRELLQSGRGESIKPGDPRLSNSELHLIATPQLALEAAARCARQAGVAAHILGDSVEGEAREVGKVLAAIALQVARHAQPFAPPCVLLSGGETTVKVVGKGRGGRNVEFLLALAIALHSEQLVHAIAADTDGVDGVEEIAGAYVAPDSLSRAWALGRRPLEDLANNDAHSFFQTLGDSIVTGPTQTNVNDFRAILVLDAKSSASIGDEFAPTLS